MKLIFISIILLSTLINAEVINVKYWKLPKLTNKDIILNDKDGQLYKKWLRSNSPELVIINNITEKSAIDKLATFFKPICAIELNKDAPYPCIYTSPTLSKDIKIKIINSNDTNNFSGAFELSPAMFVINKQIGIIVIDTPNNSTKKSFKYLDIVKKYFSEKSGINTNNIFIIGSFGTTAESLNTSIDKSKEKIKFLTGSKIIKNNKYELTSTENIIVSKNSSLIKNELIQYNITQMSKKYATNDKQENMKLFSDHVSEYYPISFVIEFDFLETINH